MLADLSLTSTFAQPPRLHEELDVRQACEDVARSLSGEAASRHVLLTLAFSGRLRAPVDAGAFAHTIRALLAAAIEDHDGRAVLFTGGLDGGRVRLSILGDGPAAVPSALGAEAREAALMVELHGGDAGGRDGAPERLRGAASADGRARARAHAAGPRGPPCVGLAPRADRRRARQPPPPRRPRSARRLTRSDPMRVLNLPTVPPASRLRMVAALALLAGLGGCVGVPAPVAQNGVGSTCYAGAYVCQLGQQVPLGSQCTCPGLGTPVLRRRALAVLPSPSRARAAARSTRRGAGRRSRPPSPGSSRPARPARSSRTGTCRPGRRPPCSGSPAMIPA